MSYRLTVAALILTAACATQPNKAGITDPQIDIAQEVGPADLNFPVGPVEFKFDYRITNQWSQPMTVIRIAVSTSNPEGGAYSLRHDMYNVRETIPPGESRIVSFWAKGYSYGRSMRESEPVTLHTVVYFETPAGTYQKVLIREIPQRSI